MDDGDAVRVVEYLEKNVVARASEIECQGSSNGIIVAGRSPLSDRSATPG
jgi:hypothetical protein